MSTGFGRSAVLAAITSFVKEVASGIKQLDRQASTVSQPTANCIVHVCLFSLGEGEGDRRQKILNKTNISD